MIGSLFIFLHLIGQNWSHGLLSLALWIYHGECILTKVCTVLLSRNTKIYVEFCVLKTITRLESITLPIVMDDSEYESLPTEKVTVHLAAGALAGVMEHCVMYPVDCVKVRSLFYGLLVRIYQLYCVRIPLYTFLWWMVSFWWAKLKYPDCLVVGWPKCLVKFDIKSFLSILLCISVIMICSF